MKTLYTVQHTQSEHHVNGMVGSWTDCDLTDKGIEQADRISRRLQKELAGKEAVLFASDLKQAKHTAEPIANRLPIVPVLKTELRERSLGKCFGKSVQWLKENLECDERTIDDRLFSDPESWRDV